MPIFFLLSISLVFSAITACSPSSSDTAAKSKGPVSSSNCTKTSGSKKNSDCNATAKSETKNTSSESSEEDEEDFDSFDPENAVPNYRNEQVYNNFNRDIPQGEERDPADAGKIFQISRVPYYRIMWMNLSKETWADTVHHWVNNNIANPLTEAGATAPLPGDAYKQPDQISVFQPMPRLRQDAIENGGYHVVGYTVHAKLSMPSYPTAVLATMPGEKPDVWAEPDDYELVYSQGVPGYPEMYEECLSPEAQKKIGIDTTLQEKCAGYLPEIFGNFSNINQSSYSIDGSGMPTRWKNWFDVITIGIWRPIPRKGYGCLGYVASNGELDKPKVEMADPRYGVSYQTEQAGTYCIREEYLVEGMLGSLIAKTKDGKVAFYEIRAKDPKVGYDKSNFFYAKAIPELPSQKDEKLWVLKKEILKELEDDTLQMPSK